MFVKCISNFGKQVIGYDAPIIGGISPGVFYQVYSIDISINDIEYLLYSDYNRPSWYPAWLFEVIHSGIPDHWHLIEINRYHDFDYLHKNGILALIGPEQVKFRPYLSDLTEYEAEAMRFFKKEKSKTDA